jgi:hypothetical protein
MLEGGGKNLISAAAMRGPKSRTVPRKIYSDLRDSPVVKKGCRKSTPPEKRNRGIDSAG